MISTIAIDRLAELHVLIRREYRSSPVIHALGLSPLAAHLINLISRYPDWPQQRLADATGREKSQVTRAMAELEKRGFIRRRAATGDGRAKAAELTGPGKEALEKLAEVRVQLARRAFSDLSEEETARFADMLKRITGTLDEA